MDFPFKHIGILMMPTDFCNMDCVYCFNNRKTHTDKTKMSDEVLRQAFEITIPYYEKTSFIWHGGEPMSMGIEFFEQAKRLQDEINKNGAIVTNSIQSNLTLIDKEAASRLLKMDFHIGGSYDGTSNSLTRHSDKAILAGHASIVAEGGKNGLICVVQSNNIDKLIEDYEWFKSNSIDYSINPYLAEYPYENDALYVAPDYFVKKMTEFFDYWVSDVKCNVDLSYFMTFLDYLLFRKRSFCCYNSCLGKWVGIHRDGSIYPCNRDFSSDFCFGNVFDYTDIRQAFQSEGFEKLVKGAVKRRERCSSCTIYDFCNGGCNNNAIMQGGLEQNGGFSCKILVPIFEHVEGRLKELLSADANDLARKVNPYVVKAVKTYNEGKAKEEKLCANQD